MAEENKNKTALGVPENIEALLCYALGWVSGVFFLLIEKENRFVRFHAMQSLVVFLAFSIITFILQGPFFFLPLPFLSSLFGFLAGIAVLLNIVLMILLMIKAWQGEWYRLPVAGDFAAKQVGVD